MRRNTRKMMKTIGTVAVAALGLTLGLPGSIPTASAAAATAVFCGISSSADKEQLKLTADLACPVGTAVTIVHDKVHLNLAGFTILFNSTSPNSPASAMWTGRVSCRRSTISAMRDVPVSKSRTAIMKAR